MLKLIHVILFGLPCLLVTCLNGSKINQPKQNKANFNYTINLPECSDNNGDIFYKGEVGKTVEISVKVEDNSQGIKRWGCNIYLESKKLIKPIHFIKNGDMASLREDTSRDIKDKFIFIPPVPMELYISCHPDPYVIRNGKDELKDENIGRFKIKIINTK